MLSRSNYPNSRFAFARHLRGRRGIALITVVMLLALATVLVLALFSTTQTEMTSTAAYSDGTEARRKADVAVNVVIAQLLKATQQNQGVNGREVWTSQPGMARQYRENGRLLTAHKLYSSDKMDLGSADTDADEANTLFAIAGDTPPLSWDADKSNWVDLNEPVIREGATPGSRRILFPIIDPRAYVTGTTSGAKSKSVEGFSYTNNAKGDSSSGNLLNGVVLSANSATSDDDQRLPMPVRWIFVLQDGTLGTLDNDKAFRGAGGEAATRANPIVARIAFWADDESCKININTAGEGTTWDTPRMFHQWDGDWARFQPMMYEYQRYPGHPATVAMSTVLFPNVPMNPPRTTGAGDTPTGAFNYALQIKEAIYDLMPKILPGGSQAGSVPVPLGRDFSPTDFNNVQKALQERLFAAVDEFLLRSIIDGGERREIDLGGSTLWSGMTKADVVERLRFFMTTNSKSPEMNPYGMPKIAMWPLHNSLSAAQEQEYRTVFDRLIARSSSIAGSEYYFRRQNSNSQTEISGITRNNQLFNYLMAMTDRPVPGFSPNGETFVTKYGDNRQQILVEIFDYIRSTNLYDDSIAERALGTDSPAVTGAPGGRLTAYSATGGLRSKTFTPMRVGKNSGDVGQVSMGSWPGHGQVVPSVLPKGSDVYRGMGRFATISEAAMQFICCAQSTDRAGGESALKKSMEAGDFNVADVDPASPYKPTNHKAPPWDDVPRWFSNFPPLDAANTDPSEGFYKEQYPTDQKDRPFQVDIAGDDPNHPGYKPHYWNWNLDRNKPLPDFHKRVQATFLLEWFVPSAGWSLINPDYEIEVDASSLSIGGKKMFTKDQGKGPGVIVIKPWNQINSAYEIYQRGGTTSFRGFLGGRKLPGVGSMPPDVGYTGTQQSGIIANGHRYDLISDYFDIPTSGPGGDIIGFDGGNVKVTLRAPGSTAPSQTYQVFHFNFPSGSLPAPRLVTETQAPYTKQRVDGTWDTRYMVPPPYWWSFHVDGALGRNKDGVLAVPADPNANVDNTGNVELGGRFRRVTDATDFNGRRSGNFAVIEDTIQSLVIGHGDPRLVMGRYDVPASEFVPHRYYGQQPLAHNMVLANMNAGPGRDLGTDHVVTKRFIDGATYPDNWRPDIPFPTSSSDSQRVALKSIRKYGDFDRGITNMEDGAYINKPDEGNSFVTWMDTAKTYKAVPYFSHTWISWTGGSTYFSPNRQVSSPGMLGSLPTGVHQGTGASPGEQREGWRTLLFRPQLHRTIPAGSDERPHLGAPASIKVTNPSGGKQQVLAMGGTFPPDYTFMDFFWMPVVEPYAISEPGSTSGKINMNYQMVPFRHIRRATGLYAAMKGEMIHSLPKADTDKYLSRPGSAPAGQNETWFRKESDGLYWHRSVDADATLALFDERFRCGFSFLSPSQICEMFLLPKRASNTDTAVPVVWANTLTANLSQTSANSISKFWRDHAPTADNLKEKPYANLYPKLTTRSNTFQVYVRTQVIRKSRSSDPAKYVDGADLVTGEYRGSAVIERYLDVDALAALPVSQRDYAQGSATIMMNENTRKPLDAYHRFRILSQKSFD